jgi:hypothetical protein
MESTNPLWMASVIEVTVPAPQLRRIVMKHSTTLIAVFALGTVLAAPAFAQAPNAREEAARVDWSSRVHVYAPDYYARSRRNSNTNPDFQLSGDR